MRLTTVVLALTATALAPGCASGFLFQSEMNVKTYVLTSEFEARPAVARDIPRLTEQLETVEKLRDQAVQIDQFVQSARSVQMAYEELIQLANDNKLVEREATNKLWAGRLSSSPALAALRSSINVATPTVDAVDANYEALAKHHRLPETAQALRRAIDVARRPSAAELLPKGDRGLVAGAAVTASVFASEVLSRLPQLRALTSALADVEVAQFEAVASSATQEARPDVERVVARVAKIAAPERLKQQKRRLGRVALLGPRMIETAFGAVRVEPISPDDPRLRDRVTPVDSASTSTSVHRNSILASGPSSSWRKVFDETHVEGDGTTEMVLVQETPLLYRTKMMLNDPTDVVSLDLDFADAALDVLDQVVGAAAAVYGAQALAMLPATGGSSAMSNASDADKVSLAKGQIAAVREIARRRNRETTDAIRPYAVRLRAIVRRARALDERLGAYVLRHGQLKDEGDDEKLKAHEDEAFPPLQRDAQTLVADVQSTLSALTATLKSFKEAPEATGAGQDSEEGEGTGDEGDEDEGGAGEGGGEGGGDGEGDGG